MYVLDCKEEFSFYIVRYLEIHLIKTIVVMSYKSLCAQFCLMTGLEILVDIPLQSSNPTNPILIAKEFHATGSKYTVIVGSEGDLC